MKKHILVVDDEISALKLIGILLERGGFDVIKSKDANAALAVLDQNTPDLIILDGGMMPGMDGIELCKVIRGRNDSTHTPILIYSARSDADAERDAMEAGANDYLPQPFHPHDLLAKVRSMLLEAEGNSS